MKLNVVCFISILILAGLFGNQGVSANENKFVQVESRINCDDKMPANSQSFPGIPFYLHLGGLVPIGTPTLPADAQVRCVFHAGLNRKGIGKVPFISDSQVVDTQNGQPLRVFGQDTLKTKGKKGGFAEKTFNVSGLPSQSAFFFNVNPSGTKHTTDMGFCCAARNQEPGGPKRTV